jgi:DNA gyrase subunit A
MGVKTIQLTENKGALAAALVVREHQELVFISQNGMVTRSQVREISRYGRASQGVRLMNIRDDDQVSAVALVVESESSTDADFAGVEPGEPGVEIDDLAEGAADGVIAVGGDDELEPVDESALDDSGAGSDDSDDE